MSHLTFSLKFPKVVHIKLKFYGLEFKKKSNTLLNISQKR